MISFTKHPPIGTKLTASTIQPGMRVAMQDGERGCVGIVASREKRHAVSFIDNAGEVRVDTGRGPSASCYFAKPEQLEIA